MLQLVPTVTTAEWERSDTNSAFVQFLGADSWLSLSPNCYRIKANDSVNAKSAAI
jgi:hypothetical protein